MADEWECDGYRLAQSFESGVNTNIAPHPHSGSTFPGTENREGMTNKPLVTRWMWVCTVWSFCRLISQTLDVELLFCATLQENWCKSQIMYDKYMNLTMTATHQVHCSIYTASVCSKHSYIYSQMPSITFIKACQMHDFSSLSTNLRSREPGFTSSWKVTAKVN